MLRDGQWEQLHKYLSAMSIAFERQFDVGNSRGLVVYGSASGRGTKRKWLEADMQYLEQCLEQQERTYNSKQLATVLEQERAVSLSADRIRRGLQKRGGDGNERGTASEENKTLNTNNSNKRS